MTIKAVLFDMDGVLIDAREWHYLALNDALELFGMPISRDEHLAVYDGLPTRRKLEILSQTRNLPRMLHDFINELKQTRTMELTLQNCRPVFHHQFALSTLKRDGLKIAVCSNSIRKTVEVMMSQSDLLQYLDFFLSNEDVERPKPDPDIYTRAIARCGLTPSECLIVEDNDHGIQAARRSGAHLMIVGGVRDVTYDRVREAIRMAEGAS